MRTVLVAVQAALAVVLVAGSVSMGRSFLKLLGIDLGYRTGHVVTLNVSLIGTSHEGQAAWRQYYGDALERLRAVPGVESAGATSLLPLMRGLTESARFTLDDRHVDDVGVREAGPDFFRSIGSTLVAGREFNGADQRTSEQLVIVNEAFARALGGGANLVGRKISGYRGKAYTSWALSAPSGKPDRDMASDRMCIATWTSNRVRGRHSPPRCAATPSDTWPRAATRCRRSMRRSGVRRQNARPAPEREPGRPRLYTSAVLFLGVFALLLAVVELTAWRLTPSPRGPTKSACASPWVRRHADCGDAAAAEHAAGGMRCTGGSGRRRGLGRYLQHLMAHAEPTGPWTCVVAAAALAATAALAVWTATGRIVRMDPTAALRAE